MYCNNFLGFVGGKKHDNLRQTDFDGGQKVNLCEQKTTSQYRRIKIALEIFMKFKPLPF